MCDQLHCAFRVLHVVEEGTAGVSLIMDGALKSEPGQFVMAWLPGVDERPFSIVDDDPLTLTVARVGPFTDALAAVNPGERVWVRGPFGRGFRPLGQRHLIVGGGCGAAALALLAKRARAAGHEVIVGLGARSADRVMLRWRFEELGCLVKIATDDGSAGLGGTALDLARPDLESRWPDAVYACGPEPMLRALAMRCDELGLPCSVSIEAVMKCGMGVCGSCSHGDRLVCQDGPVFSAQELIELWQLGLSVGGQEISHG
jgi:dihydroorotate dehydrogenase electron transfer subunit